MKSIHMKIGIDMDEVIVELLDSVIEYYYEKTGKRFPREDFKTYDWGEIWGITMEEAIKIAHEFHDKSTIQDEKPLDQAVESMSSLLKENDEIYVITARPIKYRKKVEDWIKHYFHDSPIQVISAGDFYGNTLTKAGICKKLGIKVILEDQNHIALDCAKNNIKVLLFDKPWNKKLEHENIIRVSGWIEAMKKIKSMKSLE